MWSLYMSGEGKVILHRRHLGGGRASIQPRFSYILKFKKGFQKKGIGPVFSKFRILTLKKETDKRIKQHYEKRWIKRFNPEVNFHSSQVPYNVSIKEIKTFIMIYEDFFSDRMTWFRYINDEVMKQRPDYKEHSKKLRRRRYEITGR